MAPQNSWRPTFQPRAGVLTKSQGPLVPHSRLGHTLHWPTVKPALLAPRTLVTQRWPAKPPLVVVFITHTVEAYGRARFSLSTVRALQARSRWRLSSPPNSICRKHYRQRTSREARQRQESRWIGVAAAHRPCCSPVATPGELRHRGQWRGLVWRSIPSLGYTSVGAQGETRKLTHLQEGKPQNALTFAHVTKGGAGKKLDDMHS